MVQHITVKEVKAACRKAYGEEKLLAQSTPVDSKCVYSDSQGYCCAIGVALTDTTRKALLKDKDLNEVGISFGNAFLLWDCFTWSEEETEILGDIQNAHDSWLFGSPGAKSVFLGLINMGETT